ncbi:MAG: SIR2 family protein [Magnetococcales bacterium]|nr:SIR2 family protein [Magnetococcales bacterium]
MPPETHERFNRLLRRMFEGRVIPFVGAGISLSATCDEDLDFKPTTEFMRRGLCRFLANTVKEGSIPYDFQDDRLDQLAELVAIFGDKTTACEHAGIHSFAGLRPTPAHRYLACLAREGLITEIISTNYDCCIEEAFRQSFGPFPQNQTPLRVICDLPSYQHGGGEAWTDTLDRNPVPRLYKINGCAGDYSSTGDASRIILTQRQLQRFRERQWAQDMLRDRARRYALLFVGFGSDEPQVRHTTITIAEEFATHTHGRSRGIPPCQAADQPNAPFIVAYEETLSFVQLQLLHAFQEAWSAPTEDTNPKQRIEPLLKNVLLGTDASKLGHNGSQMPADLFFQKLFTAACCRLIAIHAGKAGRFFQWLSDLTDRPSLWSEHLVNHVCPRHACGWPDPGSQPYFGYAPGLFQPAAIDPRGPLLLWRYAFAVRHPDRLPLKDGTDWYLPFLEDSVFLSSLLLFLILMMGDRLNVTGGSAVVGTRPGLGLEIPLIDKGTPTSDPMNIILVARKAWSDKVSLKITSTKLPETVAPASRVLWFVVLPEMKSGKQEWVRWKEHSSDSGPLRIGRAVPISAEELLQRADKPERFSPGIFPNIVATSPPPGPRARLVPLTRGAS